jgi:tetratricopeptide (TPR) repeat protein
MATKSATSGVARKIPVALFGAALFMAAPGVLSRTGSDGRKTGLPDPQQMAALSLNRVATVDTVKLWENRVAATPRSATFRTKLAGANLTLASETGDLGLYATAEGIARSATALEPENDSAELTLASALSGQHNFPGALAIADSILQRTPGAVNARIAAADAHLELGEYPGAFDEYDRLARELPDVPSILSRRARQAALTGRIEDAVSLARRALSGAGEDDLDSFTGAFYWFQLANYQYQTGQYDAAVATLRSALVVQPAHIGSTELLGRVLTARGDLAEAIELYEKLLERTDAADLRGELAKLYAATGRAEDADAQIRRGLDIARTKAGKYPAERRHLIGFLSDHDPAFALQLARQDRVLRGDVHTSAWLGWSLLQAGKVPDAVIHATDSLRLGTQDAWMLYQAGSVFAAAGNNQQANELLERALTLNPNFDLVHAKRARQLLATTASVDSAT